MLGFSGNLPEQHAAHLPRRLDIKPSLGGFTLAKWNTCMSLNEALDLAASTFPGRTVVCMKCPGIVVGTQHQAQECVYMSDRKSTDDFTYTIGRGRGGPVNPGHQEEWIRTSIRTWSQNYHNPLRVLAHMSLHTDIYSLAFNYQPACMYGLRSI